MFSIQKKMLAVVFTPVRFSLSSSEEMLSISCTNFSGLESGKFNLRTNLCAISNHVLLPFLVHFVHIHHMILDFLSNNILLPMFALHRAKIGLCIWTFSTVNLNSNLDSSGKDTSTGAEALRIFKKFPPKPK